MSRFANAAAVRTIVIGPCQCPGSPHARDEAVVRTELGVEAIGIIGVAGWETSGGVAFDAVASKRKLLEIGIVRWNLLTDSGQPAEPPAAFIGSLDEETFESLATSLDGVIKRTPLPNGSGAPSVDGSPESASPIPETESPTSSTTS